MTLLPAALAAAGVLLLVGKRRGPALVERVGAYLRIPALERPLAAGSSSTARRLRHAGLDWNPATLAARRAAAAAGGAFAGALLAQGDLFIAGTGRSLPALIVAGAGAGVLGLSVWMTRRQEQRADRLRRELPVVADAIALNVLAGASVSGAIDAVAAATRGVAAEEMAAVGAAYRAGSGLPEALMHASRDTVHPDAARLYDLLATAHDTGGRLADSLAELAADYRAALTRDLTSEGGRRALAVYGPILGLMIPVALLFLMYPTLVGLRELSSGP